MAAPDVPGALGAYEHALVRVKEEFERSAEHIRPRLLVSAAAAISIRFRILHGPLRSGERVLPPAADVESAVVELTDVLQEKELEAGNTSWPGCQPGHPHPPEARVVAEEAAWVCPRTGTVLRAIGAPP